jgi:hypothetical protein
MEEGVKTRHQLVFQHRTGNGWKDDATWGWPICESRKEALKLKEVWNTPQLAQRGERYVVRRAK